MGDCNPYLKEKKKKKSSSYFTTDRKIPLNLRGYEEKRENRTLVSLLKVEVSEDIFIRLLQNYMALLAMLTDII